MLILTNTLQVLVAMVLLNVWLLRFHQNTRYRGGNAGSMKEEFATYGLPLWFCYFIGALKIGSSLLLLVGLWVHPLVLPAALLISVMMVGAISMHLKIGDPWKKALPACVVLLLGLAICAGSINSL